MKALDPTAVVCVIGAGAMGAGIAQVAALAGHSVRIFDRREGAAHAIPEQVGARLFSAVSKGRMSQSTADQAIARLLPVDSLGGLSDGALVIEAIVEDLQAKRALFEEVEQVVRDDAIIATNTSSLSITALGSGRRRPERLVGMHFFNPAPVMELVEVVSGLATDDEIADRIAATAAAWGKTAVRCRSTPGFIVNRVARPFYGEALRLLAENAADAATIDAVMREAGGFRMGPLELTDLIGQDVNDAVTRAVYHAYDQDPRYRPSVLQRELIEAGRLGRKTGRGFFSYAPGAASRPEPSNEPPAQPPRAIRVEGDLGTLEPIVQRIQAAGVRVDRAPGSGRIVVDDVVLRLCDGRSATVRGAQLAEPLIHLDLALDYATCQRVAIAPGLRLQRTAAAVGVLQATGCAVSRIRDSAGMVVMRTVAMLANEAIDAARNGVADAAGIDLAMLKGVNYPRGPLRWASDLGLVQLLAVLDGLSGTYGEDRYRASPLLRDLVHAGHTSVEVR